MLQTLDRGLAIMKYLSMNNSASVSEIANVFHIPKSTASRILSTLAHHSIVSQNETDRRYRLGIGAMLFASQLFNEYWFLEAYRPLMRQVMDATGAMVHLAAWNGDKAYTVDLVRRKEHAALRSIVMPGISAAMCSTAVGKVFLAYVPEEKQRALLEQMENESITARTLPQADCLRNELVMIRAKGYALEIEETQTKVYSMAVPVFDQQAGIRFALAITSGRNIAASQERIDYYLYIMRQCADKMRKIINGATGL